MACNFVDFLNIKIKQKNPNESSKMLHYKNIETILALI